MKKVLSVLMAMLMVVTCIPAAVVGAVSESDFVAPEGKVLTSFTEYNIAPGVKEQRITTVDKQGNNQNQSYAAVISADSLNAKTTGVLAGYDDYSKNPSWNMRTVRDQAAKAEEKTGKNIVFAMNGDYFNMQTGEPLGALVMGGTIVHQTNGNPYFAITKEGKVELRDGNVPLDDVQEAIGSPLWLIRNGEVVQPYVEGDTLMPRAGVGITADGDIVFFESDGRQIPKSIGYTLHETALLMQSLGCVNALYLDGGGSATFCTKSEGTNELTVKNSPSDGTERKVSSSVFVYSDAKANGEFDHASISPVDTLYTPESEVKFTAIGVDQAGGKADLPEDGKFVLDESSTSMGTITDEGVFTANSNEGKVIVHYVSGDKICGTAAIEIHTPDELYIPSNDVSLGFEQTTDFGIEAQYKNVPVIMKDGDILWSIADEEGTDLGETVGKFNGLNFTTLDGVRATAYITAKCKYNEELVSTIKAVIGALPVVMYDFEYTTNREEAEGDSPLKYIPSYQMPRFDRSLGTSSPQQAAEFYEQGYPLYCWPNAALTDQESMKATVVSKDDGAPVRFGDHSLMIDYSYETYNGSSNANNYLRVTDPDHAFEGSPTAIGAWIYVPEGTANFVLYLNCANQCDDPENGFNLAYGAVTGSVGIDWTGWKYVTFDLTNASNAGAGNQNAPFGFYQGCGVFWISYQPGGPKGDKTASKIYLDNIQLIYGADTDDTVNPLVKSMKVGGNLGAEIVDGETVLDSNINTLYASFSDDDGKYATGIDYEFGGVKMFIDGTDVTDKCAINQGDEEIYFYDAELANGPHTMAITVMDKFGNETTEERTFTVNGTSASTKVQLTAVDESPVLGKKYTLAITADNAENVLSVDTSLKILSNFVNYWNKFEVVAGDNYTLDGEASYNEKSNTINFKASRKADAVNTEDNVIAKILIDIPTNVPEGLEVTYKISKGAVTLRDAVGEKFVSSFNGKIKTSCTSPFILSNDTMVIGAQSANIYVKDANGNSVEGVKLYDVNNQLIGVTDSDGKLTTSEFLNNSVSFTFRTDMEDGTVIPAANAKVLDAQGEEIGVTDENGVLNTNKFAEKQVRAIVLTDGEGNVLSGVSVYSPTGNIISKTDENGKIESEEFIKAYVQKVDFYAEKDGALSFVYTTQTYPAGGDASGKPIYVKLNASTDPSTTKSISWMSSPIANKGEAYVEYATKADYEANGEATVFTKAEGTSIISEMNSTAQYTSNYAVRINNITLTGLVAGTEYVYRVGDGEIMSDLRSFSTKRAGEGVNFFVIGDTQATDTTNTDNITKALAASGVDYTFGIQTGDAVDNGGSYPMWANIAKVFSGDYLGSKDLVQVLGNHEFYGDATASNAAAYFNLPGAKDNKAPAYYSVQYGNVYVAVINYSSITGYEKAAQWLVEDAKNANASWKILTMHQPAYFTNPSGNSEKLTEVISAAVDEAGIDVVFSGHDHSYARTERMTNGQVDNEDGAVYYICGSTGEKSYEIVPNDNHHYAKLDGEYNAIYLTVNATDTNLEITTHDYTVGGTDAVIDTCKLTKTITCTDSGHAYAFDNGYLTCSVCGYTVPVGTYTGFVSDKQTGKKMYLIAGNKAVSKWQASGDDWYYFDENGLAVSGKVEIDGKEYTFGEDGVFEKGCFVTETVTMKDGTKKDVIRYYAEGGTYVLRWREIDGNLYFFSKISNQKNPDDGNMYRSGKLKVDVPAKASDRYFTFDDNGILILGAFENVVDADGNVEGTRYYWGDEYVTGDFEVQGVTYTFDEKNGYMQTKDISTCKVSLDSDTFAYTSKAISPAVTVFDGDELLAKKTNYKVEYKDNVDPGTASIVITGKPERGYTGSVTVNFTIAKANVSDLSISAISDRTYTGKERKPSVTVKNGSVKLVKDTDYTVTYKNNTNPGTATVTVKGIGNYTGSKSVKFRIIPGTVTAKAASNGYNKIKVTWNKQSGVTGYVVYRSTSKTGEFKKIKTISGASTVSYVDTVSTGKTYYYKVVAYKTIDGTNYYGDYPAAVSAKAVPNAPAVKAASESYNKIKVTWNKQSGVTGYVVYRSTSKTSGFKKVKTLKGASSTSYIDSVSVGKTYYYKVVAYKTVDGTNYNSAYSAVVSAKGAPKAPTAKAASQGYNKIKISWNKQSDVTGYAIYRSTSKTKGFKRLKTVNGASAASYIDTVNTGKTYYYKVFAFKSVNGKRYYSAASSIVSAKAVPSKTTRVKVSSPSSRKAEVSWSAVAGASGYEIYRSTKSGGTYTKVKTVSSSTRKYTEGALKGGSQYFYKVRAFTTVGGAKVYGAFSSVASAKIKK